MTYHRQAVIATLLVALSITAFSFVPMAHADEVTCPGPETSAGPINKNIIVNGSCNPLFVDVNGNIYLDSPNDSLGYNGHLNGDIKASDCYHVTVGNSVMNGQVEAYRCQFIYFAGRLDKGNLIVVGQRIVEPGPLVGLYVQAAGTQEDPHGATEVHGDIRVENTDARISTGSPGTVIVWGNARVKNGNLRISSPVFPAFEDTLIYGNVYVENGNLNIDFSVEVFGNVRHEGTGTCLIIGTVHGNIEGNCAHL